MRGVLLLRMKPLQAVLISMDIKRVVFLLAVNLSIHAMQEVHYIKELSVDDEGNTPYHLRAAEGEHLTLFCGNLIDIVAEFDLYCGYEFSCDRLNKQGLSPADIIRQNPHLSAATKERLFTFLKLASLSMKFYNEKFWLSSYLNGCFRAAVDAGFFYVAQRFLVDTRVDINTRFAGSLETPLMRAVVNADERMVRLFLSNTYTNISLEDSQHRTAKYIAHLKWLESPAEKLPVYRRIRLLFDAVTVK